MVERERVQRGGLFALYLLDYECIKQWMSKGGEKFDIVLIVLLKNFLHGYQNLGKL